jgi:prepilin-type processing-associated H-X9-DG protein
MVGEKYRTPEHYFTGESDFDDQNIFVANDRDVNGYTYLGTQPDTKVPFVYRDTPSLNAAPLQDRPRLTTPLRHFGSAHPSGIHLAFCDGSVSFIGYDISPEVFCYMGGRDDGVDLRE